MTDLSSHRNPGIVFVPHTHWDREWYEPFHVFRFRLVEALDDVLDRIEGDAGFRFTLDGQTAAILDYLEMRPENEDRVRAAVLRGQLSLGPWLILMDEFLSSGETIVRNLRLGHQAAERLGGASSIGYLPDMFGHIAQMPQILRKAGLEHTALWRGVPGRVSGHAFRWSAPDGSSVRVEYLFDGYGNGMDILLTPDELTRSIRDYRGVTADRWGEDDVLAMAGTDHALPNPRLMTLVREHDSEELPIRVATLEEYLSNFVDGSDLVAVHGELRSHARGNILPGVLSIRKNLKEAMARAERTVDDAERLAAQWTMRSFEPFFDMAWHKIVESTAHDSVVGSGTDETVEQVASRLAEATHAGRAIRDSVLAELAATVGPSGFVVASTCAMDRTGVVEVDVPVAVDPANVVAITGDGVVVPAQFLHDSPEVLADETMAAAAVHRVLRRIHRRELFGLQIDHYSIEPGELTFHLAEVAVEPEFDLLDLLSRLTQATKEAKGQWRVRTLAQRRSRVLVALPVPASGVASFTVTGAQSALDVIGSTGTHPTPRASQQARSTSRSVDNGLVRAVVTDDGCFSVTAADGTTLSGVGRLVDGGDRGDSYNYGSLNHDVVVDVPESVNVSVVEDGPVRAILRVDRTYAWPAALDEDVDRRSAATVSVATSTFIEVRIGEPFVRLSVAFVNAAKNHRLRLHIPLPEPVTHSESEGQFSVTRRGLEGEGGWGEFPLPTYPASSFVTAGPATLLLTHPSEYEIVENGRELALTLLRAVGAISVNLHPLRDEPAASEIPIPGAQDLGIHHWTSVAILPSPHGYEDAEAVRLADEFRRDLLVARGTGEVLHLPGSRAGLRVEGRGVAVSAIHRIGDAIEVRLIAMTDTPTSARIGGRSTRSCTSICSEARRLARVRTAT